MNEWIDYFESTYPIYMSRLHAYRHFEVIARDIIGYITSPDAVVLDYACGPIDQMTPDLFTGRVIAIEAMQSQQILIEPKPKAEATCLGMQKMRPAIALWAIRG